MHSGQPPYYTTRTSVQCLSQCNHAPESCLGAQSTVWNKGTDHQRRNAATAHCMLHLLAGLPPVYASLAPLHPKSR